MADQLYSLADFLLYHELLQINASDERCVWKKVDKWAPLYQAKCVEDAGVFRNYEVGDFKGCPYCFRKIQFEGDK